MDTIAAAPENFLSRVGRLIAGIAYDAIEQAEGNNKLKVVGQAIREIERAEGEARDALASARAEEYRLNARRTEIEREMTDLAPKIEGAIADGRDDLARAGIARQMDMEAQFEVLSRAVDENNEKIENSVTSLRAVLSALQDAEQRRADLAKSEASASHQASTSPRKPGGASAAAKALRAGRAVARATGVPAAIPFSSDIDELSTLHRDKEIAARLARLKSRS
jgi:phage shock protein A